MRALILWDYVIFSHIIGRAHFTVCLKEDQQWWYKSIHEMWAGKRMAEELRDPSIIHQAALNVLLIDAVVRRYATFVCYVTE